MLLGVFLAWLGVQLTWIKSRHEIWSHYGVVFVSKGDPSKAPWGIRMLGERGVETICLRKGTTDEDRQQVQKLYPESKVLVLPLLSKGS